MLMAYSGNGREKGKVRWASSRRDHFGEKGKKEVREKKPWNPAANCEEQESRRLRAREKGICKLRESGALPGDYVRVNYWLGRDAKTGASLGAAFIEGIIGFYTQGKEEDDRIYIWTDEGNKKTRIGVHVLWEVLVIRKYKEVQRKSAKSAS